MDTFWIHVAIGFIACLITASWGFRAGRDIGIEQRGNKDISPKLLKKLKEMDNRIQVLKQNQDRTVTAKK